MPVETAISTMVNRNLLVLFKQASSSRDRHFLPDSALDPVVLLVLALFAWECVRSSRIASRQRGGHGPKQRGIY